MDEAGGKHPNPNIYLAQEIRHHMVLGTHAYLNR